MKNSIHGLCQVPDSEFRLPPIERLVLKALSALAIRHWLGMHSRHADLSVRAD